MEGVAKQPPLKAIVKDLFKTMAKKHFHLSWTLEAFEGDPTFFTKRMFSGLAAYYQGKMILVLMESPGETSYRGKEYEIELWNGILLPTEREYHSSLLEKFPTLIPHPVLKKWLYLPMSHSKFETVIESILERLLQRDPLLGIFSSLAL